MRVTPKLKKYSHVITTIDSHTMGECTRIVTKGFPNLVGKTMMEKKQDLEEHYDIYRRAVMLEPRGHKDMFGAVLTEPTNPKADFGVIFLDNNGCLNMCGHGSIGVSAVAVETSLVKVTEPYTNITLEAPAGLIQAKVKVKNGHAESVSFYNVPSFLYKKDLTLKIPEFGKVKFDIAFGGNFFAIVNGYSLFKTYGDEKIKSITNLGMELLKSINENIPVKHPRLDISSVDLVEFSFPPINPLASKKNIVVFGDGQIDRSPCGTGTSAKVADLYARGKLKLHDKFIHESVIGSLFCCEPVRKACVGDFNGIIPKITGNAWITGFNTWVIDESDPLKEGFVVGY